MASTVTELMRRRFGGKSLPYDAEIEYLESTGTQYINTGITPDANTGIQCIAFGINPDNFMVGLKDTASGNTRWAIGNSGNNRYYYGYGSTSSIFSINQDVIALIGLNFLNSRTFNVSKVDGTGGAYYSLPVLSFTPQNQIRIFGSSGVVASYTTWSGKMYSVKISQNADVIMDLIPVRVGTTGYMYDRVSGQLFGNDGTGNFNLGNDV